MSRPCKCRRVFCRPQAGYFKPRGIPVSELEEINLTMDELEAMRLTDLEGMYQEEAAAKMKVSRQTMGNIAASAHRKVTDALLNGKALKIEGGVVKMMERHFVCYDCKKEWTLPYGSGKPECCPACQSRNVHRAVNERGFAGVRGFASRCRRGGANG